MAIIAQPEKRMERKQEKMMAVLRFLRTATYSTAGILGKVMGVEHRSTVFRCLKRMERAQVIHRHVFNEFTGTLTLWGITATGQHFAAEDGEEAKTVVFNSSKISSQKLKHYLTLQELVIAAGKAGWTDLKYCDKAPRPRGTNQQKSPDAQKARPDLLALSPEGHRTAIEYERSLKAAVRYKTDVIPAHVQRLNAREYDFVLWITHAAKAQASLERIIKQAVAELKQENAWYLDVPLLQLKRFQFANLQTWPARWQFDVHRSKQ